MNLFQVILKLLESGQTFTLLSFGDRHYIEVGRYGYVFSRMGKSMGGWIDNPTSDAEWNDWKRLLME